MTIEDFLRQAGNLRLDAEVILAKILDKDRSFLAAHAEDEVLKEAVVLFKRRQDGEPLAYVLGEKEFYGRKFRVSPDVLIPRPETEGIVEMALERINSFMLQNGQFVTVIDVGTGSGAIGVTIDLEAKKPVNVIGLDNSMEALRIAEQNCNKLGARVRLLESDLLEVFDDKIASNGGLVLVANLPYVDKNWGWLSPELTYEPANALYAEDGGLKIIFDFLEQAKAKVATGFIILEADPCQHEKIRAEAKSLNMKVLQTKNFGIEIQI